MIILRRKLYADVIGMATQNAKAMSGGTPNPIMSTPAPIKTTPKPMTGQNIKTAGKLMKKGVRGFVKEGIKMMI